MISIAQNSDAVDEDYISELERRCVLRADHFMKQHHQRIDHVNCDCTPRIITVALDFSRCFSHPSDNPESTSISHRRICICWPPKLTSSMVCIGTLTTDSFARSSPAKPVCSVALASGSTIKKFQRTLYSNKRRSRATGKRSQGLYNPEALPFSEFLDPTPVGIKLMGVCWSWLLL